MKIIDLLNKRANDEEMPKIIKFGEYTFHLVPNAPFFNMYFNCEYDDYLLGGLYKIHLNDEVEVIEESKEIEKIRLNGNKFYSDYIGAWIGKECSEAYCEFLSNKLNEIIDKVNSLLKKEDE